MWRFAFLTVLLLTASSTILAETPQVSRLQAYAAGEVISVSLELKNAFEQAEISRSLESGLPTGFSFQFELVRKRPNWFDDTLATSTIEVIATYNSITREYLINYRRDGKLVKSETVTDLSQLRERMTRIDEPALFQRNRRPSSKLAVRARADISRKVIFYIVPSLVSTEWRQTRVKPGPAPRMQR